MKTLKSILVIAILALGMFNANAQKKWSLDPTHSSLKFSITHLLISEVDGKFKTFEGAITTSKDDFSDAVFNFSAKIASVDTDNKQRDGHLQSPDFFDAAKYPEMTFVSSSFKKVSDKTYTLKGNLTIHGVTKKVTFNVVYGGTAKDNWGNTKAGFKATTTINRKDFKVNGGGAAVGDEVKIQANLEVVLAK